MSNACQGAALQEPQRLAACRGIAHAQLEGDTYIVEMLGAHMAERLGPEASAEYAAALDARRVGRYRLQAGGRLESAQIDSDRHALKFLHLMQSHRTEQELQEALLSRAGVSTEPPADFSEAI
jgi:hypothetical protein